MASYYVLPWKKNVSVAAFFAAVCLSSLPQFAQSFVQATPAMSSASTFSPTRLDRTGGRPAPFVTVSSSGSTIEAALGSLGSLVRREMGEGVHSQGHPRCEIGVLFYTQRETGDDVQGARGVQDAFARFHDSLPFVDQLIASPTLAASTSQQDKGYDEEGRQKSEGFTATLALINNPDVKVDTFVMSPAPDRTISSSLREEGIGASVVRALERSTGDGADERSPAKRVKSTEPDNFEVICLAFGVDVDVDADAGRQLDCHDIDPCISQMHRLNSLLRNDGSRGGRAGTPHRRGVGRCPLVASVTAAKGGVFVSRRDEETNECSTVAGDVVGAILSGSRDSSTSFQLVHAGKHAALRGSQFRIKHMKGGNIAEVMPVLSMEASSASTAAAVSGPASDGYTWRRPRCGGGAISAAEWCQQAVASSTLFEKLAMQSALGVGVLKRMGADGEQQLDYPSADIAHAPLGVMPCLPAQSCFDVQEVEVDGSLRLSQGAPVGELRAGDLCDFRAVGALASMQAEQDAYAWLHASRISAAIRRRGSDDDSSEQRVGASVVPTVQGCLVASAAARFAQGFEDEGCHEVVAAASGHGGCTTVGMVSDVQLVSVDNTMVTCSSNAGLASIYICGDVGGQE